jgi:hypothetical protein
VSTNELILTWELHKIFNFVKVENKKIGNRFVLTALFALNYYAARIRHAIGIRSVYNTVMQVCLHWRNGIIQPQVLSPSRLIQIPKISQDSLPRDLEVPVVLSEAYVYIYNDIVSGDVYLVGNNPVCTVQVPLVMHSLCSVCSE